MHIPDTSRGSYRWKLPFPLRTVEFQLIPVIHGCHITMTISHIKTHNCNQKRNRTQPAAQQNSYYLPFHRMRFFAHILPSPSISSYIYIYIYVIYVFIFESPDKPPDAVLQEPQTPKTRQSPKPHPAASFCILRNHKQQKNSYNPSIISNLPHISSASRSSSISQKIRSSGSVPENLAMTHPPFWKYTLHPSR